MLQAEFGVDVEAFHRLSSSHAAPAGDVRGRVDRPRLLECQLTRPRPRGADTATTRRTSPFLTGQMGRDSGPFACAGHMKPGKLV
jgi:hypothetical protein